MTSGFQKRTAMNTKQEKKEIAALELLKSTGVDILAAAQLTCIALKIGHGKIKRTLRCLTEGEKVLKQQAHTVSFAKAVEEAMAARTEKRARTQSDFRYMTRKFMKRCPKLNARRVRSITPEECARYIEMAFDTPRQRQKARLILSGVFGTAVKRGWCSENPVAKVEVPKVKEKTVPILTPDEIEALKKEAESYQSGICAAAVGIMLYAGIRPHEVARLSWEQIDVPGQAIYILPQHSKTGGARKVTIHKPLLHILQQHRQESNSRVCPPNWLRHWRELRRLAGWNSPAHPWPPDTLRHTYASYHISYFRNYAELQIEIGHHDATLLRTRYIDQRGVVKAKTFWESVN